MTEVLAFAIAEMSTKKRAYTLTLLADQVQFTDRETGQVEQIWRHQARERIEVHDSLVMRRTIVAKIPKRVTFKLEPETFAALESWLGVRTRAGLEFELERRMRFMIPIGLLFILGALPLAGVPAVGAVGDSLDPRGLALGMGLLVLAGLAKWKPHRLLFLLDGLWFLALAADVAWDVSRGASPLWLVWVVVLLMVAIHPFSLYRRFTAAKGVQTGSSQ